VGSGKMSAGRALVDLRELRDRIHRELVIIEHREAVGTVRPLTGIVGQRLSRATAPRPTHQFEPLQAFAGPGGRRLLQGFSSGHTRGLYRRRWWRDGLSRKQVFVGRAGRSRGH